MNELERVTYNERLFSSGLRGRLHTARFKWVAEQISSRLCPCDSVVELGCGDGRVLDYLPSPPSRYVGFDANWEGNLDRARKSRGNENYSFRECSAADEFVLTRDFDIAICLETLEHLPTAHLGTYLERLAKATRHYLFASVPNEKGLLFAAKWLAKRTSGTYYEGYSAREFLYATFGQVRRIPRYAETGNGHKGFDWQAVVEQVSRYFDVESVTGLPFLAMPKSFGFTIGIVATARRASIRSQAKSGLPAANFAASRVV